MFTGLIEEVGKVISLQRRANQAMITLRGPKVSSELAIGDSVAVNGACLTATSIRGELFTVDVSAETLRRTTLERLAPGHLVNLERALRLGDRLGGHLVSGHVDCVGTVQTLVPEGNSTRVYISAPAEIQPYVVTKGSITVDGVSLTIAGVEKDAFWIAVIPHTQRETTLIHAKPGKRVNLEADMLAKYVERMISLREGVPQNE